MLNEKRNTMSAAFIIVLELFFIVGVLSGPSSLIVPCKKNDEVCMTKSANMAAAVIGPGVPSLGVDPLEIIRFNVSGEASKLFFELTNYQQIGFTKCEVGNVKLNLDAWKLKFDLKCPRLETKGHLVVSGELLDLPIEGDDEYHFTSGKLRFDIDTDIEKVTGGDGQSHLAIKKYDVIGNILEPYKFDYVNFKPKIQLSPEDAEKFERNKFRTLLKLVIPPYVEEEFAVVFKSVNRFLESVAFDDLFID